jgi:hypothetical protein
MARAAGVLLERKQLEVLETDDIQEPIKRRLGSRALEGATA